VKVATGKAFRRVLAEKNVKTGIFDRIKSESLFEAINRKKITADE